MKRYRIRRRVAKNAMAGMGPNQPVMAPINRQNPNRESLHNMIERHKLLADYLAQLVKDKGEGVFLRQPESVQILICMFVVEDMFEMFGKGKTKAKREG